MANSISPITSPPDVGQNSSAQSSSGGVAASKPSAKAGKAAQAARADTQPATDAATASPSANLRLEISDDKAAGCFVYKIINRTTGEVVEQIPQEQILKLRESDGYLAGDVIKAQA